MPTKQARTFRPRAAAAAVSGVALTAFLTLYNAVPAAAKVSGTGGSGGSGGGGSTPGLVENGANNLTAVVVTISGAVLGAVLAFTLIKDGAMKKNFGAVFSILVIVAVVGYFALTPDAGLKSLSGAAGDFVK